MTSKLSGKSRYSGRMTPLAGALALTLLTGLTVSASTTLNPVVNLANSLASSMSANTLEPTPTNGTDFYTVVLRDEPVATYTGGTNGLAAPARRTNTSGRNKLDLEAPATKAYAEFLLNQQNAFINELSGTYRRPVEVMARMQHALNAVIIRLTAAEAAELSKRIDVLIVEREKQLELHTDNGPGFIGAPAVWTGQTSSSVATSGEGIIVGIIDSGINWASPAFAAVSPADNYAHVNPRGAGNYLGQCVAPGVDVGRCNDKLIGIYNFGAAGTTGTDTNGHGSHTASTVAGNRWNAVFANGTFAISGVAPRANVISYLACPTTCPTTATTQSVNQAVLDSVDVINFSISGGASPWTDTTSVAFRNANAAGVFVSASAGNTSATIPDPQGQVNHLEPWVHTVAASTQNRVIAMELDLTSESSPPANTQNLPLRPGAPPLPTTNLVDVPLIKSPNFANGSTDGCAPYPAGTFTRLVAPGLPFASGFEAGETAPVPTAVGGVAVLNLDGTNSSCASGARRTAALNAGAIGVIFVDVGFLNLGASGTSWAMRRSDWDNLEAGSNPATATVTINVTSQSFPAQGDRVAGFSFRGPRLIGNQGLVKPDITAPGVDILAVGAAGVVGNDGVYLNNGTSMSSPHNAGAAALMSALHPTWTPSQIKSALSLSSNNTGSVNEDGTPVRLWDYGSGRVNLAKAAKVGLIMNESAANYLAANPAAGGEISTLNLPSIGKNNAVGNAVFTRTFTRARLGAQTYNLSTSGFPAGSLAVSPTSFTIPEGGTQVVTVTVTTGLLDPGVWTLGEVALTPAAGDEPLLHLPVAMFPGGPAIAVSPGTLSGTTNTSISNDLTISNTANPTLNWQVQTTGTPTITVINTGTTGNGQLAGTYVSPARSFHWSQNFDVASPLRITTLQAKGFTLPSTTPLNTTNTPSITFSVYADNAGEPAGAPGGFGAPPIWTFTGAISAANGITTTGGNVSLNLNAANVVGTPLNLPAGRFWMTVTPTTNSSAQQTAANPLWAWFVSADTPVGNAPRLFAPHLDPANLQPPTAGLDMLAGQVQGVVDCTLPAWVGLTTTAGSLGFAGSQTIPVTFNAGALPVGTYTGNLCISSNATNAPVVPVGLTFTVTATAPTTPTVSKAFLPTSVSANTTSTLTITLDNPAAGVSTLTANMVDTFPAGLVVAATPNASTTCGGGSVTAAAGSGSVSLGSGATIPATGSCNVVVDVTSASEGSYNNVIAAGALQTSTGNNASSASATLTVTPPVVVSCTTSSAVEVEATAGTPGPTGYATLKDAFDAVNAGTHQGTLAVSICGDTTETAPAVLNASGSGSSVYTAATIRPAGGAARTISGATAAGGPMIDLNGADNVTIDGLNSGGNALTISNTTVSATSGTSTIRFIGGATGNTITRTSILGSANMAVGTNGGTIYFATDALTPDGNDNNTISNNNIGPAGSNLPTKAIYGNGSTTNIQIANSGIVIDNNNIFDFFSPTLSASGIHVLNGNDLWTISGNRIYQTAPRVFTATGQRYAGITLNSGGTGVLRGTHTVSGNRIGFGAADGTGTTTISGSTNTFRGIDVVNVNNSVVSNIQGNVISGINQTTASTGTSTTTNFIGIMLGSSDGLLDAQNNRVGSLDGSSTIVVNSSAGSGNVVGIYNFSSFATNITGNEVGSITINGPATANGFRGIHVFTGNAVSATVENNTVANVTNNQSGGNSNYVIQTQLTAANVIGNTVRNITSNGNAASVTVSAISVAAGTATAPSVIARNVMHSMHNTVTGGAAGAVYAMDLTLGTQANVVERNLIHSISVATSFSAYQVWGMILRGTSPSTAVVKNNMIRLGFDAAGASMTTPFSIIGIRDSAGTGVINHYYHNSVYIGGSNVDATGSNTFAFNSNTATTTRNFQNNIFWNGRSNAVGGGTAHLVISIAGTAPSPTGTNSNNNVLFASGTDGLIGVFNSALTPTLLDWQTATGLDANSFAANPQFIAPNGDAATGDLHINPSVSTPVEASGVAIVDVTDDFDGQLRAGLSPTDIGADAGNFTP